jgi:hypothetical protein
MTRRYPRLQWHIALVLVSAGLACRQPGDLTDRTPGDSRPPEMVSIDQPSDSRTTVGPRFRSYLAEGALCPSGSVTWSIRQDGSFGLDLQPLIANAGPIQRSCRLNVAIEVPAGYRFRDAAIHYRSDASGSVTLTTRTVFQEGGHWGPTHRALASDWSTFREELDDLWSPTCTDRSRPQFVNLELEIDTDLGLDAYLELEIVGEFGYDAGVEWARCADDVPTKPRAEAVLPMPPPAAAPMPPAAAPTPPPAADPKPPAPLGGACAGRDGGACEPGLLCHFASEAAAVAGESGACVTPLRRLGDACDGYPRLACAADLTCRASRCERRTVAGGVGAHCTEHDACAAELLCVNESCQAVGIRTVLDPARPVACSSDSDCAPEQMCSADACVSLEQP